MQSVAGIFTEIPVQLTVTAGVAYTAGDQVGGLITLPQAALGDGLAATLEDVIIIDAIKQNAAMVVYFFNRAPILISSDNDPIQIADDEMREKCIGYASIANSTYTDLATNSVSSVDFGLRLVAKEGNGTLYAVMKTTGTPTYTGTGDLYVRFKFAKEF